MAMTVYNPQKGRLETIGAVITPENTTWFEDCLQDQDIHTITDVQGGLLIHQLGYNYPLWIYDVSRAYIGNDQKNRGNLPQISKRQMTAMAARRG